MKKIKFEIKSLDKAKEYAAKELRVNTEFIDIEVLEKKGMIMKTYIVEASVNVDAADQGYEALKRCLKICKLKHK